MCVDEFRLRRGDFIARLTLAGYRGKELEYRYTIMFQVLLLRLLIEAGKFL
ncbi:MAG TPA: hypothetical protein VJZ75_01535 [Candidatus Bathyarchaeia archaeon]|nr:hypothetical protein [Candidatus Bathyarchaeia archaeon]